MTASPLKIAGSIIKFQPKFKRCTRFQSTGAVNHSALQQQFNDTLWAPQLCRRFIPIFGLFTEGTGLGGVGFVSNCCILIMQMKEQFFFASPLSGWINISSRPVWWIMVKFGSRFIQYTFLSCSLSLSFSTSSNHPHFLIPILTRELLIAAEMCNFASS